MSKALQAESVIRAPIETVWQRLTDWHRAGDWVRRIRRFDFVELGTAEADGAHPQPGMKLIWTRRGRVQHFDVVVVDAPELLQITTVRELPFGSAVEATYTYLLDHITDTVTHVVLEGFCEVTGPLAPFAPFVRGRLRQVDGYQPTVLKEAIEEEQDALASSARQLNGTA